MAVGLLTGLSLLWGCGYHITGRSTLPGNARTIGVQMLVNRSIETQAEAIVTNALADELNRRRPGTIGRVGQTDAILSGTIVSINREIVSRSSTLVASTERITVTISLQLKDTAGNILWKRSKMAANANYTMVDGDITATEDNRRRAIEKAASRLAEDAFRGLTNSF